MNIKVMTFKFSSQLGNFETEALDQFIADKEVHHFDHHFFEFQQQPYLAVIIHYAYLEGSNFHKSDFQGSNFPGKSRRVDPKNFCQKRNGPFSKH